MRRIILVDAGHWHALLDKRDELHARAEAWRICLAQANAEYITTEMVLWEVLNGNSKPHGRQRAVALFRECEASALLIHANRELVDRSVDLFEARADKGWSLTDCLSFLLMRDIGITEALTADQHFVQAGFRALLLEEPPK